MSIQSDFVTENPEQLVCIGILKELPAEPAAAMASSHNCNSCQLSFLSAAKLQRHLLVSHIDEERSTCKDCRREFQQRKALQKHVINRICVTKRVVPCPYCAAPFPNRSKLATHVSTVHLRAPKTILCDACGAVFSRRGALQRHLATFHGGGGGGPPAPRRCPLCAAAFRAVDNLQRHLVSRHANWKRWVCSLCAHKYNHSVDLKRHLLRKHGLLLPAVTGSSKKDILDVHVLPGPAEAAPLPAPLAERRDQLRRLLAMVPSGQYDPELLAVFGRLPLARPGIKQAQPAAEPAAQIIITARVPTTVTATVPASFAAATARGYCGEAGEVTDRRSVERPQLVEEEGELTEAGQPRAKMMEPVDTAETAEYAEPTETIEPAEPAVGERGDPTPPPMERLETPVAVGAVEHMLETVGRRLQLLSGAVLCLGGEATTLPLLLAPPPPPPPPPLPAVRFVRALSVTGPTRRRRRRTVARRAADEPASAPAWIEPAPPPRLLLPAPPPPPPPGCEPMVTLSLVEGGAGTVTLVEAAPDGGLPAAGPSPAGGDPVGGYTLSVLTHGEPAAPLPGPAPAEAPLWLTRLPLSAPSAAPAPPPPPPPPLPAVVAVQEVAVRHSEALRHPAVWEAAMLSENLTLSEPAAVAAKAAPAELDRPPDLHVMAQPGTLPEPVVLVDSMIRFEDSSVRTMCREDGHWLGPESGVVLPAGCVLTTASDEGQVDVPVDTETAHSEDGVPLSSGDNRTEDKTCRNEATDRAKTLPAVVSSTAHVVRTRSGRVVRSRARLSAPEASGQEPTNREKAKTARRSRIVRTPTPTEVIQPPAEENRPTASPEEAPAARSAQSRVPPAESRVTPTEPRVTPAELRVSPAELQAPPAELRVPPAKVRVSQTEPWAPPAESRVPPVKLRVPQAEPWAPPAVPRVPPAEPRVPPAKSRVSPTELRVPRAESRVPPAEPRAPLAEPRVPSAKPRVLPAKPRVPPADPRVSPAVAAPSDPPRPASPGHKRSWVTPTVWSGGRGKILQPRVITRMDRHVAPRTLALLAASVAGRSDEDRRQSRFPCAACDRALSSKANLRAHLVSHTGETPFQCSACPAVFRHFANARGHLRRHSTARCACDVCGRDFLLQADLRRHRRTHGEQRRTFPCTRCPSRFSRADNLARHVRVEHGAEPPPKFSCDVCQKEFKTEAWLKQHKTIHKAAREQACTVCGRRFALRSYLERHMKSHDQRRVYCDVCPRRFINIKNLTVHRQSFHRNPVPLTEEEQQRAAAPRPEPARSERPSPTGVRARRISVQIVRTRRLPPAAREEREEEREGEGLSSDEDAGSDEDWRPD